MITRKPPPPPPPAPPGWVPLRGASGRLYGYYDPQGQIIEVKRKGEAPERISLATFTAKG